MQAKPTSRSLATLLCVIPFLTSTAHGRLPLHGHKHRAILSHAVHKPTTGPNSGILIPATNDQISALPVLTDVGVDADILVEKHHPLNVTEPPVALSEVTPLPQVHTTNLEFGSVPTGVPRRHRSTALFSSEATSVVQPAPVSSDAFEIKSTELPKVQVGNFGASEDSTTHNVTSHDALVVEQLDLPLPLVPRQESHSASATLTSASLPSSLCPNSNGTTYTSDDGINYRVDCDVDYLNNNLQFQLVGSFAGCVQKCDAWNYDVHQVQCVAALFVPNREKDADDCYLKSNMVDPTAATLPIEGAVRIGYAVGTSSVAKTVSSASATTFSSAAALATSQSKASPSASPSTTASGGSSAGVTYASGDSVIVPRVASSHLQGTTQNTPAKQYLDIEEPSGIKLATNLLKVGANGDLTTNYGISDQTGVLEINITTQSLLRPLTNTPHLSRDGGRGGMVNGEHLFVFCDTGSYTAPTSSKNGNFLGFVSSSVSIDVGMKGLTGGALTLQDGIGEWSDDAGRMRGFAPLTNGEMAYNLAMQGQGQRYAVWPESDIIPLDATTGIIFAPIVYDNVNQVTKDAVFTYTGTTLLTITAGGKGGPVAERTVVKMFQQDEVEWGCLGGIRSWGPSGIGGNDGNVYLFGNVAGGVLLARTSAAKVADVTSVSEVRQFVVIVMLMDYQIEYWNGKSWTNDMLSSSATSYFIAGAFMDVNVFYSPRHLTFIIVYLTIYADSTFYYRYLEADQGILPPFAPGGDSSSDYVENILKYKWSEQQVLYKAAHGLSGKYIYSGGPHLGYYGSNDIINGGSKMLLSWTAPTGLDPSTLTSEYQLNTAEVDFA
ncbi:hypothetical protein ACLMJK_009128 [Lecanora helva]